MLEHAVTLSLVVKGAKCRVCGSPKSGGDGWFMTQVIGVHSINSCMVLGKCFGGFLRRSKGCWISYQYLQVQQLGTQSSEVVVRSSVKHIFDHRGQLQVHV